ncbi:hypothetical protein BDF19DRAFT_421845 [Syncephalis fuscata]|nr:hypothetical protein BDF19DRAFT_421845 [Syncephalis fuscata]
MKLFTTTICTLFVLFIVGTATVTAKPALIRRVPNGPGLVEPIRHVPRPSPKSAKVRRTLDKPGLIEPIRHVPRPAYKSDITKVQAIFPSSIKDSAQQLALYFKPKQTKRQKDFYGYPLGQNIAFGNYKLILEKSSTSNNEISYASGYLLDKNGQADQAIDILCGHDLYTQYSQVKDKSIFRSVDFSFIDEYNPKSGHICYMTKSTGNSYQFPSPEFRKILQKNIQPIYILINQLRKSILFAEKLGWYYKLEPECTYNAKYESNKKNTGFNTQEYDENMKYYFHRVLVMTGFGTIKLRQAVELYTELII